MKNEYRPKISSQLRTVFGLLACFALVGCLGTNNPKVEPFQPNAALTYDKQAPLETHSSALVKAIASTPAVSRALSSAAATKERVAVARTQKEMTVSGSGSSGFETDTDDGSWLDIIWSRWPDPDKGRNTYQPVGMNSLWWTEWNVRKDQHVFGRLH